jgi:hypothetical protein
MRDGSRVHREPIDQLGIQLAPAASPRLRRGPSPWPPHRHAKPASESSVHASRPRTAPRPYPPDLSRCHVYRAFALVPLVCRLISLAEPDSSGSAEPSRLCQRCSHPIRRLPDRTALSFYRAAANRRRTGRESGRPHRPAPVPAAQPLRGWDVNQRKEYRRPRTEQQHINGGEIVDTVREGRENGIAKRGGGQRAKGDQQVVLGPWLAAVCRVRAVSSPPVWCARSSCPGWPVTSRAGPGGRADPAAGGAAAARRRRAASRAGVASR